MPTVDDLRAELGSDTINELMDAYYSSGLSLKELKELYDLPQSYTNDSILNLFPMVEVDEKCPLCGNTLRAPHVSRSVEGAASDSYDHLGIACTNCNKTKREAMHEFDKLKLEARIRRTFSQKPKEFDWSQFDSNNLSHVVLNLLISCRGDIRSGVISPIYEPALASAFLDSCKALKNHEYIEPTADFDKWLDGFSEENGELVFYWYKVPFAVNIKSYCPLERKPIIEEQGREYIELGEGERKYWLSAAKELVMMYLEQQMYEENYKCSETKLKEFDSLLDTMLLSYSPAQITSLIWTAMATAVKQANEGPEYKNTGNWAMGVILNRAKKALSERWDLHPNMPTLEVFEPEIEQCFFNTHVPLGETWVYRSIPEINNGRAEIKCARAPKNSITATASMISAANRIAIQYDLEEPDYLSYEETKKFLQIHRD